MANKERPHSIDEALRVLDEALASPGADIKNMVTDEYQNLHTAISQKATGASDFVQSIRGNLTEQFNTITANLSDLSGDTTQRLSEITDQGIAMGREIYRDVDTQVRANPWPFIGGIAVGTFALGFLLGGRKETSADVYTTEEVDILVEEMP